SYARAVTTLSTSASAYERAATACASSAAAGQLDGISRPTTPRTYASSGSALTICSFLPFETSSSLPRYDDLPKRSGVVPGVKVTGELSVLPDTTSPAATSTGPGGSATFAPFASTAVQRDSESRVTCLRPSARSTRTVGPGCAATVVPW